MLLDILQHHQSLILQIIGDFCGRKRDYQALLCTCKQLYNFISSLDTMHHYRKYKDVLADIAAIEYFCFTDDHISYRKMPSSDIIACEYARSINISHYYSSQGIQDIECVSFVRNESWNNTEIIRYSISNITRRNPYHGIINMSVVNGMPKWAREYVDKMMCGAKRRISVYKFREL
jgi:hypothetical protein